MKGWGLQSSVCVWGGGGWGSRREWVRGVVFGPAEAVNKHSGSQQDQG